MKVFFDGVIKIASPHSFVDKNDVMVEYFTYIIQSKDGETMEINSKRNFYGYLDKPSVMSLNITKDGKNYKVQLLNVQTDVPGVEPHQLTIE